MHVAGSGSWGGPGLFCFARVEPGFVSVQGLQPKFLKDYMVLGVAREQMREFVYAQYFPHRWSLDDEVGVDGQGIWDQGAEVTTLYADEWEDESKQMNQKPSMVSNDNISLEAIGTHDIIKDS